MRVHNFYSDILRSITYFFDNIVADNLVNLIQKTQKSLMKELPKTVEIFDEESDNLIGTDKQFNNLSTVNLSVVRLMDYIVQDEFAGSMQKIISSMAEQIMSVNIELQDHLRLLVYNLENRDLKTDEFKDYLDNEIKSAESNFKVNCIPTGNTRFVFTVLTPVWVTCIVSVCKILLILSSKPTTIFPSPVAFIVKLFNLTRFVQLKTNP